MSTVGIIGAGPTGSALAVYLLRAGFGVTLIESASDPTLRVGESLIPQCAPLLEDLGVDMSGFLIKHGAVFTRGDDAVRFDFADGLRPNWDHAWQVPRREFDRRMRAAATSAGAEIHLARATGVSLPGVVHTDAGDLRFDQVVDAGGRNQLLARQLRIRTTHPRLRNAAVTAWYRGVKVLDPEAPGDIVIASFEGGWFWFIPFADGTTSVGAVTTPEGPRGREGFSEAVRRCDAASARLAEAEPLEPLRGASDFTCSATAFFGEGWALVGDAATFLDPVFSTGVCLGLHGARWLADALSGLSDLATYEARVRGAVAALEPVVEAFYAGRFVDLALSQEAWRHEQVRRGVVSLLSGDVFDPAFDTARRLGLRIPQLAQRLAS